MSKFYDYLSDCCSAKVRENDFVYFCSKCGQECEVITFDTLIQEEEPDEY